MFLTILIALVAGTTEQVRSQIANGYSLGELIEVALSHNDEITEARWRIDSAQSRVRKARAIPRLRLESFAGLVPDAEGNVIFSPSDSTGLRKLGPFARTQLEIAVPVFTFGQITHLRHAAQSGVAAEKAALYDKKLQLTFTVRKLYYGCLLASDIQALLQRLLSDVEARSTELKDDDTLPLANRYRVDLTQLELQAQKREAEDQVELAHAALKWHLGLSPEKPLTLIEDFLTPVRASVPPLSDLTQTGLSQRPDQLRLKAGLQASQALIGAATAAFYPQLLITGGVSHAAAPGRTDQRNPWVKDDFNYLSGGVFVTLRQSLEWGVLGADLDKAKAEYRALVATADRADAGIRLDIRRNHATFKRREADLTDALTSRKLTRQWLKQAQEEYELDPETIGDLVTALSAWAKSEKDYYQAIYNFNMALAGLERAVGGLQLAN